MTAYHVDIDTLTSTTPDPEVCAQIEAGFTRDADAAVGGSLYDHRAMSFSLAIDAASAADAEHAAIQSMLAALRYAYVEAGEILNLQVIRWDLFEADLGTPNYPDIVSAVEAADMLGVTRQRVHQLWRDHKSFPEPLYELRNGPLWLRGGIEAFADRWDRKPGRPDYGARMRERVTSALIDAGITVADSRVFLGSERNVILQLAPKGPSYTRRKVAVRVIEALNSAGLGVTDEGSHSAADMEAYLADGHMAEVFEVTERRIAAG